MAISHATRLLMAGQRGFHRLVGGFSALKGPLKHGDYRHCIGAGTIDLKTQNLSFMIRITLDGRKMVSGPTYHIKKTPGQPLMNPSFVIARVNNVNKYDIEPLFPDQRVFAGEQKRFMDQVDHEWMIPETAIAFTLLPGNRLKFEAFSEIGSQSLDHVGNKKPMTKGKFYVDIEVQDKVKCKEEVNRSFEIRPEEIDDIMNEFLLKASIYRINPRFESRGKGAAKSTKALPE